MNAWRGRAERLTVVVLCLLLALGSIACTFSTCTKYTVDPKYIGVAARTDVCPDKSPPDPTPK